MNDQYDNPPETDEDLADDVDTDPADPIEESPDAEQAAEPVDNVGEVIGRRNLDLPLENNPRR